MEPNESATVITFLKDTKEGKFAEIDLNLVETPRITITRNDFLVEDEIPTLYSITNQL